MIVIDERVQVSYDASMQDLQNNVQEQLSALLMDPSSVVKRAVLHNISSLCIFLGRQRTNDVLLSHMITYLNDRDWLLRYAFFESIVDVAACAGGRSLEEYILPLMIQALSGAYFVPHRCICGLTVWNRCGRNSCREGPCSVNKLVRTGLIPEDANLGADECNSGIPLSSKYLGAARWAGLTSVSIYAENFSRGATAFIAAAAKHLPSSDVWCILYPSLRHFLRSDIKDIDEQSLLTAMKPPVRLSVFVACEKSFKLVSCIPALSKSVWCCCTVGHDSRQNELLEKSPANYF